jgi:hypothetical protein
VRFAIGLCALVALSSSAARGGVINFDGRSHGEIVTDYYQRTRGITITAVNFQGGPDLPIAFDTARTQTDDRDLEDPWTVGNLGAQHKAGKILILAENDIDANGDGRIDRPDDQGSMPSLGSAGQLIFDFGQAPQFALGLDLIDVEPGDEIGFFAFYFGGTEVARITLDQLTDSTSNFYDPTIVFGDNSANRVQPITAAQLNIRAFDNLVIDMGMCYGVDNVTFEPITGTLPSVPEPTALAAMGLAFTVFARRSRNM